jgi:superfamily II DNA/RNA helicase
MRYCSDLVTVCGVVGDGNFKVQQTQLKELPDILVATPGRLVEHCEKGSVALKSSLRMLVVDEVHTYTIITPSPHYH